MPWRRFKKPLRYKGHDYRAPCTVHVNICTWRRQALFGRCDANGVHPNDAGWFVRETLLRIHEPQRGIGLDTFIIMPDHVHAIIHLGTSPDVDPGVTMSDVVHQFKVRVVRAWRGGVRDYGWPRYMEHLWHPSYYDTLIEHDGHLETTREYILANPARWWAERYQVEG
jgi:REP element-mobilizing transposase RayT